MTPNQTGMFVFVINVSCFQHDQSTIKAVAIWHSRTVADRICVLEATRQVHIILCENDTRHLDGHCQCCQPDLRTGGWSQHQGTFVDAEVFWICVHETKCKKTCCAPLNRVAFWLQTKLHPKSMCFD